MYTFPDGGTYIGEFKDDKINGLGSYTGPDGVEFSGKWKDDKFLGDDK